MHGLASPPAAHVRFSCLPRRRQTLVLSPTNPSRDRPSLYVCTTRTTHTHTHTYIYNCRTPSLHFTQKIASLEPELEFSMQLTTTVVDPLSRSTSDQRRRPRTRWYVSPRSPLPPRRFSAISSHRR
jgi:hypothetical protein